MRWVALILVLTSCTTTISKKAVISGRPAKTSEVFATVALLAPSYLQFCSGIAIAPRLVVTAAHCVVDRNVLIGTYVDTKKPNNIIVSSGYRNVLSTLLWHYIDVVRIIVHRGFPNSDSIPDIEGMGRWDDIALLVLENDVRVSWVPILEMAKVDKLLKNGTKVSIAGYGQSSSAKNSDQGVLYTATTLYRRRSGYEFWIGGLGLPDHCPGDSGGPTYLNVGGQLFLIGAVSRGGKTQKTPCGEGGINTLIPAYTSWIKSVAGQWWPPKGPPPKPKDGCSTSGSSGGFLFGLITLLVVVRRRYGIRVRR